MLDTEGNNQCASRNSTGMSANQFLLQRHNKVFYRSKIKKLDAGLREVQVHSCTVTVVLHDKNTDIKEMTLYHCFLCQ